MKLKKVAQIMLISCSILALGACSTTKKNQNGYNDPAVMDANGAQAAGIGESENYGGGDSESGGHQHMAQKRTYYFDYDSNVVHNDDKPAIVANANRLAKDPNKAIKVEGHTDPRGSREYNVALGERRANAVAEELKSHGVASNQVEVVSYGAERLAVPGYTDQDYQLDRRAVLADAAK